MEKLDMRTVTEIASAVEKVRSIDSVLVKFTELGRRDAARHEWGKEVKRMLGQNLLFDLGAQDIGDAVFCSIVNTLLHKRQQLEEDHGDVVSFPPAPVVRQIPTGEE